MGLSQVYLLGFWWWLLLLFGVFLRDNIHLHYAKDDPIRIGFVMLNPKKCHIILFMCFLLSTALLKEKYIK